MVVRGVSDLETEVGVFVGRGENSAAVADVAPFVSVVIPTRRRPQLLRRCLRSLGRQMYPVDRYEIIVVDDDRAGRSDGQTGQIVRDLELACKVSCLPNPGKGPAAARNEGWRRAKGEIIAFTDDDTVALPVWLAEGVQGFIGGVEGVAGRTIVPLPRVPTDSQRCAGWLQDVDFITCNVFYRREALEACGGFDPQFEDAYREDTDLTFNMWERGKKLIVAPNAVVYHPARRGRFLASLRGQRRIAYDALLYKKHHELYQASRGRGARVDYYLIVGAAVSALVAALAGFSWPACILSAVWAALDARFFLERISGTSHKMTDLIDMAVTSTLIPFSAIFWRFVGAVRYKAFFW